MRLHKHGLLPSLRRPWLKPPIPWVPRVYHPFSIIVSPETTQVTIPVGASGNITLDIHTPPSPSPTTPLLIYLPPGPLVPSHHTSLAPLSLSTPLTVVRINYRLSPQHQYPIPIHDVLAGYDWVVQHLVRGAGAHNAGSAVSHGRGAGVDGRIPGVAVCGELLGGGLAAMLACTEGRVGRAGMVKAAVVGEAVVDWTGMFPLTSSDGATGDGTGAMGIEGGKGEERRQDEGGKGAKRRASKAKPKPDSWRTHYHNPLLPGPTLLHARDTLFAKPEHQHDPFASPLLFFRTASSDIPPPSSPSSPSSPPDTPPEIPALIDFIRPRRAHRRHPPIGSGLVLPRTRVYVGRASVLRDQGVEFAEGMRRSWWVSARARVKAGGAGSVGEEDGGQRVEGQEADGSGRVEVREVDVAGLWGEEEMCGVGEWVAGVLRGGASE